MTAYSAPGILNEGNQPIAVEDTTNIEQESLVPYPVINTEDTKPTHNMEQQLTDGQVAMSVDFNPGGREDVNAIKQIFADAYDTLTLWADKAVEKVPELPVTEGTKRKNSIRRWEAIAKTDLEKAQMAAVKAVTR